MNSNLPPEFVQLTVKVFEIISKTKQLLINGELVDLNVFDPIIKECIASKHCSEELLLLLHSAKDLITKFISISSILKKGTEEFESVEILFNTLFEVLNQAKENLLSETKE